MGEPFLQFHSDQHDVMMTPSASILCSAFLFSSLGISGALFIPEELPTLLSFLYTNIPPIFKGTDSRLGVGFRVGPNADFQVQVELGPQTRTQPAGTDAEGTNKKRETAEFHVPLPKKVKQKRKKPVSSDTPLGWLQMWKTTVGNNELMEEEEPEPDLQPAMDVDTVMHLRQLYKLNDDRDNETK